MRSISDIVAKLGRLSSRERWLLAQAWLLFLLADLSLRVLPFSTILHYCDPSHLRKGPHTSNLSIPTPRISWLVEKAGRYCPVGTSCLKEALVLSHLLARRGIPSTLRIGVGRPAEVFAAHAWVEQDGRVILGDREIDAYARLI